MNLKELARKLESMADGEHLRVSFKSGEELLLSDCEIVDVTISGNRTTLMANVVEKVLGDKRFHKPATKIEFYGKDILSVCVSTSNVVIYETNT